MWNGNIFRERRKLDVRILEPGIQILHRNDYLRSVRWNMMYFPLVTLKIIFYRSNIWSNIRLFLAGVVTWSWRVTGIQTPVAENTQVDDPSLFSFQGGVGLDHPLIGHLHRHLHPLRGCLPPQWTRGSHDQQPVLQSYCLYWSHRWVVIMSIVSHFRSFLLSRSLYVGRNFKVQVCVSRMVSVSAGRGVP